MRIKCFRGIEMYLLIMGLIVNLTGCTYFKSIDVLQPLAEEEIYTFYGEGRERLYLEDELIQEVSFREWKGRGKNYHSEAEIAIDQAFYEEYYEEAPPKELVKGDVAILREEHTYNEEQMIVYLPHKNEYSIKEMSLVDDVRPRILLGINEVLNAGGLKDYAMAVMNQLAKEYTLAIQDNVKINGRQTQHITAISNDENSNEVQEIWIDQNSWLIIKQRVKNGNYLQEFEYTKFLFNPKIDERLFQMDIPKDAQIVYIDNNLARVNEIINLDEATKRLGVPIFYLEEKQDITLKSTRYIERIDENGGHIKLVYTLADGREVVVENSPLCNVCEQIDLGYEEIVVQGKKASYQECGTIKLIEFVEENTLCEIYVKNSEIERRELIQLANKLVLEDDKE